MSLNDPFGGQKNIPLAYADEFYQITPDDNNDLPKWPKALMALTLGDIAVRDAKGNDIVVTGVIEGTVLPLRAVRVLSTGTTATVAALV